jgi:hypothetical protein
VLNRVNSGVFAQFENSAFCWRAGFAQTLDAVQYLAMMSEKPSRP